MINRGFVSSGCAMRCAFLAAVLAVAGLVAQASDAAQDPPTFRSAVQTIEVDVRVLDQNGNAVRGLTADDFTVLEGEVPQQIESLRFLDLGAESPVARAPAGRETDIVTNRGTGRMWVMLLGGLGERARLVARQFVDVAMGPNDEVAVVHLHGNMSAAQGFTRRRDLLLASIDRLQEGALEEMPSPDRTAFRVLEELCERLGQISGRRKAVLFFDPPGLSGMPEGVPAAQAASLLFDQRDALRAATRHNVALYVVSSIGLSSAPESDLLRQAGQRLLAEETGGDAIINSNNFEEGYQRFVRDSNEYYLLSYSPQVQHRDGEFHQLTVRVNRPDVTVRARPGYYAPRPGDVSPAKEGSAPDGLSAKAHEALREPLAVTGLPLDVFVAPFRRTKTEQAVLIGAQVEAAGLRLGPGETIEVAYRAVTTEGRVTPGEFTRFGLNLLPGSRTTVASTGLRFADWLALPHGRHQIRFVVNQPNGATGMVVADVDVPDFTSLPVSISGIAIASTMTASQHSLKGDETMRKVLGSDPTALRRFSRRDTLTAYAEVYTNERTTLTGVTGTLKRVDRARGVSIELRPVVSEPGRSGVLARIPLDPMSAGDYVLEIDARAGGRDATRRLVFTIAQP